MSTWLSKDEELEKNQDAGIFFLIVFKLTSRQEYDAFKLFGVS